MKPQTAPPPASTNSHMMGGVPAPSHTYDRTTLHHWWHPKHILKILKVLAAASRYGRQIETRLHVSFEQASAHQLHSPGEDLCERMVPVEELCQLTLELTQAGPQRRHVRMHSCRLALRRATGGVMLWRAVACQSMPVSGNLDVYSGES